MNGDYLISNPLGRNYRIESDYGIAFVYCKFDYTRRTGRVDRSNQYWALLKWFNHWFGSDGWVGRYELMGWQTFPSGARFLVERFEPNELGYQPPLEIAEKYWDNQKLSGHAA